MNNYVMRLPELNCLKPNEHTTFKKLVEEIAECNTALEELQSYEDEHNSNWLHLSDEDIIKIRAEYKTKLSNVLGEIMDIAQVCASQLFVFEKLGLQVEPLFAEYKDVFELKNDIVFQSKNGCRNVYLTPTNSNISLQGTMNKIILHMGIIAQLSKFIGENGEKPVMGKDEHIRKYVFQLFKIIQKCFDLIYCMNNKYHVDVEALFDEHVNKLIRKGYYKG